MRLTKEKKTPKGLVEGEKKLIMKFLWTPTTINGEVRWLEMVRYEVVLNFQTHPNIFVGRPFRQPYWKKIKWVDIILKNTSINEIK